MQFVKPSYVSMKAHPAYNEAWLEARLIEDPSLLGLGDLDMISNQRSQPTGGRLDLLLSDPNAGTRYSVEIQLGALDESHIIRTLEYWDVERKRYPQYEHVAVIVAEDITSRFLNVIGLLHSSIPLMAIQLQAVAIDDNFTLVATRVYDYLPLADEEEESRSGATRETWEGRSSPEAMSVLDSLVAMARETGVDVEVRFVSQYVALGTPTKRQVLIMRPRKAGFVNTEFKVDQDQQLADRLGQSPLISSGEYDVLRKHYRANVRSEDLEGDEAGAIIKDLIRLACEAETTADDD